MATRLPNYQMRDGRTRLGQDYFNPIWADLDSRLDTLERIKLDWNAQVAQLRDLGLQRIDEYIRPVVDEVDALLVQATEETNGLAATLVDEHITPLVTQVNQILQQAQADTDNLAQTLVDEHIAPLLTQAQQLLSDIQGIKQAAQQSADELAAALDAFATTASRTNPSTDTLLQAKAMNDHRQSEDHDARYYTKQQLDAALESAGIASDYQEFTSSGTWTKDSAATWIYVEGIGGGGGGGVGLSPYAGGGGGGGFNSKLLRASEVSASVTVTVGAGGNSVTETRAGNDGGDSTFGSYFSAPGGKGGYDNQHRANNYSGFGGGVINTGVSDYSAGGGGSHDDFYSLSYAGGNSVKGGAGGSAGNGGAVAGGISIEGGNGGQGGYNSSQAHDGQFPGGGGGGCGEGTSGAGADGVIRVWQW